MTQYEFSKIIASGKPVTMPIETLRDHLEKPNVAVAHRKPNLVLEPGKRYPVVLINEGKQSWNKIDIGIILIISLQDNDITFRLKV